MKNVNLSYLLILLSLFCLITSYSDAFQDPRLSSVEINMPLAEKGDPEAMYMLGFVYAGKKDYAQSAYWFKRAAELDHTNAQYRLSLLYDEGKGVEQDHSKAVEWLMKGASRGDVLAQCSLAKHLLDGLGIKQDVDAAIAWYERAAKQGYADAKYEIGKIYYEGRFKQKEYLKAIEWFERAEWRGQVDAANILYSIYSKGEGVPQDDAKATKYLVRSANHGIVAAEKELGLRYLTGKGVEQDNNKAAKWLLHAAMHGNNGKDGDLEAREIAFKLLLEEKAEIDPDLLFRFKNTLLGEPTGNAQLIYGLIYLQGKNVLKNFRTAEGVLYGAAYKGNADAQYYLGMMYKDGFVDGTILVQNNDNAKKYLKMAADQGHTEAMAQLAALESGVSSKPIPHTVPYEKEFGTPEFPQGLPYSQFKSHIKDPLTNKYFALWKQIFMQVNELTEDDFNSKLLFVKACNSGPGDHGDSFNVEYMVVLDWLKIKLRPAGFPIIWPPSREEYRYLNLRTGIYLDVDEIMKYVNVGRNDSYFKVNLKHPLAFATEKAALTKLSEAMEVDQIPEGRYMHQIIYGQPVITAWLQVNAKENHCISGKIDLVTGNAEADKTPCEIY